MTIRSILAVFILALTACATGPAVKYNSPNDWVEQSKRASQIPLGTKADEWSYSKTLNTKNGVLAVRTNFLKQQGTTCHFDVEFTNAGQTELTGTAGLSQEHKKNVYTHNSGKLRLKPGEKTTYRDLEARECPLKWGTSTEMDTCASCMIAILYAE